jgi:hypothetical protein
MKKAYVVVLAALLWGAGCKRERDFGQPEPEDVIYVFDSQTNKIEGLLVVPEDLMQADTMVRGIEFPRRLYDKKRFTYYVDYTGPFLEFVKDVAKKYNFPISWDPEPIPELRSREGPSISGNLNFFEVFREIVSLVNERGLQRRAIGEYDPNEISVGIVKKDAAVIKRVKSATEFEE